MLVFFLIISAIGVPVSFFLPIPFKQKLITCAVFIAFYVLCTIIRVIKNDPMDDGLNFGERFEKDYYDSLRTKDRINALKNGRAYYLRKGYSAVTTEAMIANDIAQYIG